MIDAKFWKRNIIVQRSHAREIGGDKKDWKLSKSSVLSEFAPQKVNENRYMHCRVN